MKPYLDLLRELLDSGNEKGDRTGTGTLSKFGHQMRFDLQAGFPLVTTKKIFFRGMVEEMLWFLSGSTNIKALQEKGVHFWDDWATTRGEIGPMYGKQLRKWDAYREENDSESDQRWYHYEIDQVAEVIAQIKNKPNSRRHVITTWNPSDLPDESDSPQQNVRDGKMALAPCHGNIIQFYVHAGKLSCQMYQRSADSFLGLPVNIASYALLTHMIAQQCDLEAGDLVWAGGDVHLYMNHLDQARLQLKREPYPLPTLLTNRKPESIFDYRYEDFQLLNYLHHPAIKAKVSV